jgi:hypothetical protein
MTTCFLLVSLLLAVLALRKQPHYGYSLRKQLQENIEQWRGVLEVGQLERSVTITLVIIAMFPLWEVGRDLMRFKKLR